MAVGAFLLQNRMLRTLVNCHKQVTAFIVIYRAEDLKKHP